MATNSSRSQDDQAAATLLQVYSFLIELGRRDLAREQAEKAAAGQQAQAPGPGRDGKGGGHE